MAVSGRRRSRGPRTRWLPRRRCKRYRWREGDPHLFDLPLEVLRYMLKFTMPRYPNERWLWMSRVGGTCTVFRALTREEGVAPRECDLGSAILLEHQDPAAYPDRIPPQLQAPFLRSFIDAPWKGAELVTFAVTISDQATADAARAVLTTPGILPRVFGLRIFSFVAGFVNAELLHGLARSLPRLSALDLAEKPQAALELSEFGTLGALLQQLLPRLARSLPLDREETPPGAGHVTLEEFGTFGALLQQPLEHLLLRNLSWMTDAHMGAFLPYHGRSLLSLATINCFSRLPDRPTIAVPLGDATLAAMQENGCQQHLRIMMLTHMHVTPGMFTSFLAGIEELEFLNISATPRLGPEVMDDIIRYHPGLTAFVADCNNWVTDEAILLLVQAQMDRFGSPRLETLSVWKTTRVTPTGLRSVLEMAGGTLSYIRVGRSRAQLTDEALDLSAAPALQGSREDWNALARDFPNVVFK